LKRGEALQKLGKLSAAREDADRAVALAPERADAYLVRANVMTALGRRDDARKDYRKALDLTPSEDVRRRAEAGLRELGAAVGNRPE
jgi:Tfp pilus assembly protein PilF